MGAAYFYHLTRAPLEATLPTLLDRARQAGWRVAVRGRSKDRMVWLDDKLWLGGDEGFLPHGLAGGPFDKDQPVLLTTEADSPNGAACVMAVDGAEVTPEEVNTLERVCILFDGNDHTAVEIARDQWRKLTGAGCAAQYWSQEDGAWAKKAESGGS
ncbi:DNA polymerase III subunit chi [Psychromarinibacter sp. S121]|uniref:DNA polymerase III subunit chi n=1 Tax=Psychromarinibacter sp. S121 TaxID=3415127 RepID=UPI003C7A64F8